MFGLTEIKGSQIQIDPKYGKVVSMTAYNGLLVVATESGSILTFQMKD